jgi:predicted nucleic acid-binding protein
MSNRRIMKEDEIRPQRAQSFKRAQRKQPVSPPDFFIGAHAQVMGWTLASADEGRFRTCFSRVCLSTP